MNGKNWKRQLSIMLIFLMMLLLCACSKEQEQPTEETNTTSSAGEKMSLSNLGKETGKEMGKETEGQIVKSTEPTDNEADSTKYINASLQTFRDGMECSNMVFGAAYLGYVGGLFEEGFATGFPAWLKENNADLLAEYSFVESIDHEHIIGSAGHLYCIVPEDEKATLSINRIEWNSDTLNYDTTEVLYRSESGEPVLLFANLDGDSFFPDTQVFLTDSNGNTYEWYPCLSEEGYLVPCYREGMEICSWDFTAYYYSDISELKNWMRDGWLGPTELTLSGTEEYGRVWHVWSTAWEGDRNAFFMMQFYPSDGESGRVDIDWNYTDERDYEEQWSGYWNLITQNDRPSYLTISLSMVGGKSYGVTDGPMYIAETYPILLSPDGEKLVMGAGLNGVCLPFMSQSTIVSTLWLPEE